MPRGVAATSAAAAMRDFVYKAWPELWSREKEELLLLLVLLVVVAMLPGIQNQCLVPGDKLLAPLA